MLHPLPALVVCLALILYFVLAGQVGWARGKFNVAAPAITGHPEFERIFRVQQNTLESLIMFLPGMWLFSQYVSGVWAAAIGALWLIGRILYAVAYRADAARRGPGFGISALASAVLVLGALVGAAMALVGGGNYI